MRRRIAWLALAITSLIVVAFTVPLMLLVRQTGGRSGADQCRTSSGDDRRSGGAGRPDGRNLTAAAI